MSDAYVKMLIDARDKLNISTAVLCEGVYTADMFYLVEQGKRDMDRVTAKRLLARLGVDGGNYEHYLDYPDYEAWRRRMRLINSIEDDELEEAENLLGEYSIYFDGLKYKNRASIERQFFIFMQLQLLKHKSHEHDVINVLSMYEEALKLTVPNIDDKPLKKLMLSPVEIALVLEYKSRKYANTSIEEKLKIYEELFEYLENAPLGKVSTIKVYPKICVRMFEDIRVMLISESEKDNSKIYKKLFQYCEGALSQIRERKLMYYLTEILEMRLELLSWFEKNGIEPCDTDRCKELIAETSIQLEELIGLYEEYDKNAYMTDDCYLYRESGIYCINEVVKTRRTMMNIPREELGGEDMAATTVWRVETEKKTVHRSTLEVLFGRLNLFPSCVNTGIVTDKKEVVELYEELRYAIVLSEYDEVKDLLRKLRSVLPEHPINEQVLLRIGSFNELRMGEKSKDEHIESLKQALECTVKLADIQNAEKIFVTTEELTALYLISGMHKDVGDYGQALVYIKELHNYCKDMEDNDLVDGRMGIYEMVMAYVASLYGDIGRYEESNDISERLIKMSLRFRRGNRIHSNMYNIAWNHDDAKISDYDYNAQVQRCINISRLLGDAYDERFYCDNLKFTE